MRRSTALVMEILSSPLTAGAKITATAVVLLLANTGGSRIMDYSQIIPPEEAWLTIVVLLVPFAILFGIYTAMRSYTEMLNDKGITAADEPYSLNYALGTVLGIALGAGFAFIASGWSIAYMGLENVPAFAYAVWAVVLALAFVWIFVTVVHRGIETTLKIISQYAKTVTENLPGVVADVTEAADTVTETVETVKSKKSTKTTSDDQLP